MNCCTELLPSRQYTLVHKHEKYKGKGREAIVLDQGPLTDLIYLRQ